MVVSKQVQKLNDMLDPTIEAMGYESWGIEYLSRGKESILRIFIDSDQGITVDDCARVSHQVSGILDVEDPIQGEYSLEVSSPGMDRPLFYLPQYENYLGRSVHIRLAVADNNRKNFTGVLAGTTDSAVKVEVDGESFEIDFDNIYKAHLK